MKVARTKVKAGQDPVFDETFDLDDIPPDVLTFTVTVMNRGRRAKDAEVAEVILLKFIYSEKATKYCEIFPLLLTTVHTVKSKRKILQNFVAFSEYMNFNLLCHFHEFFRSFLIFSFSLILPGMKMSLF